MKNKIVKLIDLKSIITILMALSLVIGFFKGMVSTEVFIPFASMVFTFYFTKPNKEQIKED